MTLLTNIFTFFTVSAYKKLLLYLDKLACWDQIINIIGIKAQNVLD